MDIETPSKDWYAIREPGWYVMTQDRINQFATVTEDEQFIHIDKEWAPPARLEPLSPMDF